MTTTFHGRHNMKLYFYNFLNYGVNPSNQTICAKLLKTFHIQSNFKSIQVFKNSNTFKNAFPLLSLSV